MSSLEDLFCSVDDFCQRFQPQWQPQLLQSGLQTQKRSRQLCLSQIMTIVIAFHQQGYPTGLLHQARCRYWRKAFPDLVSYPRFIS